MCFHQRLGRPIGCSGDVVCLREGQDWVGGDVDLGEQIVADSPHSEPVEG